MDRDSEQQSFIAKWEPLWLPAISVIASSVVSVAVLNTRLDSLEKRVDKHDLYIEKTADVFSDIKSDVRELKTIIKESASRR